MEYKQGEAESMVGLQGDYVNNLPAYNKLVKNSV